MFESTPTVNMAILTEIEREKLDKALFLRWEEWILVNIDKNPQIFTKSPFSVVKMPD